MNSFSIGLFLFLFFHRRKDQEKAHRKGKFSEKRGRRRRLFDSRGTLYYYYYPPPPPRISLNTGMEKNQSFFLPFLPFFFPFLFYSNQQRISLVSCACLRITMHIYRSFFFFFFKQSIWYFDPPPTSLPCEALERRGLRIYAERHARRVQLFRYKFVHFLWNRQRRIVGWISAHCLGPPPLLPRRWWRRSAGRLVAGDDEPSFPASLSRENSSRGGRGLWSRVYASSLSFAD